MCTSTPIPRAGRRRGRSSSSYSTAHRLLRIAGRSRPRTRCRPPTAHTSKERGRKNCTRRRSMAVLALRKAGRRPPRRAHSRRRRPRCRRCRRLLPRKRRRRPRCHRRLLSRKRHRRPRCRRCRRLLPRTYCRRNRTVARVQRRSTRCPKRRPTQKRSAFRLATDSRRVSRHGAPLARGPEGCRSGTRRCGWRGGCRQIDHLRARVGPEHVTGRGRVRTAVCEVDGEVVHLEGTAPRRS